MVIELTVRLEARSLIHFKEPWLGVRVDENVEAENLEAHVECPIVGLACSVIVQEVRLDRDEGFDNQVRYLQFQEIDVDSIFCEALVYSVEGALA